MIFNFKECLPYIIDAYSAVLGEEYRDIIAEKINSARICFYTDVEGELNYIDELKSFKKLECLSEFFASINLSRDNQLDRNIINILENNINLLFENGDIDKLYLLLVHFDDDEFLSKNNLLNSKIIMINFLLNRNDINRNNYKEIMLSQDYSKVLIEVDKILQIYLKFSEKYSKYDKTFSSYESKLESEIKLCKNTKKAAIRILFVKSSKNFPEYIRNKISSKTLEEQTDLFLCDEELFESCGIYIFNSELMNDLYQMNVNSSIPLMTLVELQNSFLKKIGFDVPEIDYSNFSEKEIFKHIEFVKNEIASGRLFDGEFVDALVKKYYAVNNSALRTYHMCRKDYIDFVSKNKNIEDIETITYGEIMDKTVCVVNSKDENGKPCVLLYFGIGENTLGLLSYCFLHECGHVIDEKDGQCGFDKHVNVDANSFNEEYRKYERFNETINDIFAIEATEYLENQGIFILEDSKYVDKEIRHKINTSDIDKSLLNPLVTKYRKHVIEAKVMSDPSRLTYYIGENNYEELVFLLNWVDDLRKKGLAKSLADKENDTLTEQYSFILERAEFVYQEIQNFYDRVIRQMSLMNKCN